MNGKAFREYLEFMYAANVPGRSTERLQEDRNMLLEWRSIKKRRAGQKKPNSAWRTRYVNDITHIDQYLEAIERELAKRQVEQDAQDQSGMEAR